MNMFEYQISRITYPSKLRSVPLHEIEEMERESPLVPEDYFTFLKELGCGSIGGMMMYSGLVKADDLLNSINSPSEDIVIFGDNWQGSCYGFDLGNGGQLVEITPEGDVEAEDRDFRELIHDYAN